MKLVLAALCLLAGSALAQVLPNRQQYLDYPQYQQYPGQYRGDLQYPQYRYRDQQYQTREAGAPILQYSNDVNPDGSFQYSYQTGNGISAQAAGFTRNIGVAPGFLRDGSEGGEAQVVQGSYSYTAPDGQTYTVNYVADENGYRADGAHLPQPSAAAALARVGPVAPVGPVGPIGNRALNYYQPQLGYQPFQQQYRPFDQRYNNNLIKK